MGSPPHKWDTPVSPGKGLPLTYVATSEIVPLLLFLLVVLMVRRSVDPLLPLTTATPSSSDTTCAYG